jgi:hypothetical protein
VTDVWTVVPRRGRVEVTLTAGPPRPLVARLKQSELAESAEAMRLIGEAVRRGQFSRVQLGAAFQEAIGRDPFRQVGARGKERLPWWGALAIIITGTAFAANNRDRLWMQIAGYAVALVGAVDLVALSWRRISR